VDPTGDGESHQPEVRAHMVVGHGVAVGAYEATFHDMDASVQVEGRQGLGMMFLITVKLEKQGKMPAEAFAKAVRTWPEVVSCCAMTGETDSFQRIFVVDVKSNIVLEDIKDTTALPLEQVAPERRKRN